MAILELSAFDYDLPEDLIAAAPAEPRDGSRMLVLQKDSGRIEHRPFADISAHLKAGDCLVLNRTKVLKARLMGRKPNGGKAELLLLQPDGHATQWRALARGLSPGSSIELNGGMRCDVLERMPDGEWLCRFPISDVVGYLDLHGQMPLPPYILRRRKKRGADASDEARYQTVFADVPGSVAAPTAGLHFTPDLLNRLRQQGVTVATITLHIGWGTFRPILTQNVLDHRMLPEPFEIDPAAVQAISAARRRGGRVVAVGTSTVRALETATKAETLKPQKGMADIFIYPGYRFKSVDAVVTNFHLPRSTPLLLAAAFAGREKLLAAYRDAIGQGYRFYSYGDAMLIV